MAQNLSEQEKEILLEIAREAISAVVEGKTLPPIDAENYSPLLKEQGTSFVTLTKNGRLRGCIGALEPYQPLVLDVQEHAAAAATRDYRFPNVRKEELPEIIIEISRLTPIKPLIFSKAEEIVKKLRPHVDGVLMKTENRRATFLPQVWEKVSDPEMFLNELCLKMGVNPDFWRKEPVEIYTYQVEEFEET